MTKCATNLQVGVIDAKLEVVILECDEVTGAEVPVDISSASVKALYIRRPDYTLLTKTATFSTDGTDGKLFVQTEAGDINIEGTYRVQGHIAMTGWNGRSTIGEFEVDENLV